MRLHRLTLRDVKGVTQRTVDFPDHGVVVIEGPNEVGKSTLLEAFDRLLDPRSKATSRSAAVRALQPVGRDVGPSVEAEFTVGRHRVRFAKRWLRDPLTTLEVLEPAFEQHAGSAAQERLDAILQESLDRTLWDALRFAQSGELAQLDLQDSGVLSAALDGASGASLHSEDGAELLERVEREYLRYWTRTGRVTGELRDAKVEAERARDHAVDAHGQLVDAQRLMDRFERLRAEHDDLAERRPALVAAVDEAAADAEEVAALVRARDEALARLQQARERYQRAQQDKQERERLVGDVESAAASVAELEPRLEAARLAEATAQQASEDAVQRVDAARLALQRAREVGDRAAEDLAHLERTESVTALAHRVAMVTDLSEQLRAARRAHAAEVVTMDGVRDAERLAQELAVLHARHEAASPTVVVRALTSEQHVAVDGESLALAPEGVVERQVLGDLTVELPGRLRVEVRPDAGAQERRQRIERVEGRLRELLRGWGVDDLDAARARAVAADEARRDATSLAERLSDVLRGAEAAHLSARLGQLQEQVEAYAACRDPELPLPQDLDQAKAVAMAAQRAARNAEQDAAAAERACREVDRALSAAGRAAEGTKALLDSARATLARAEERLTEARSLRREDSLHQAVRDRAQEFARVEAQASVARRSVEEWDVAAVQARLQHAQQQLDTHDGRGKEVHERQLAVAAQVELISGEGRQEAYELAVAEADEAHDSFRAVLRRAQAARRLHATLGRHRELAHQAYVLPYRQQLERLGRSVYGDTFSVAVSADLQIESRTLDGTTVPFAELSGGAKEQLGILARLAVAALVDPEHGVPVVLDDALGYTDPDRLGRVARVFAGPAERTQVILLTCTPERYAAIPDSATIRLTA